MKRFCLMSMLVLFVLLITFASAGLSQDKGLLSFEIRLKVSRDMFDPAMENMYGQALMQRVVALVNSYPEYVVQDFKAGIDPDDKDYVIFVARIVLVLAPKVLEFEYEPELQEG